MLPSETDKGAVCLLRKHRLQYFDHLIPLSFILKTPIYFYDKSDFEIAQKFYPTVDGICITQSKVSIGLLKKFGYFVSPDLMGRAYQQILRHVYCPHGFSDKYNYVGRAALEDITLVYGQNMLDQFDVLGVQNRVHSYVAVGNYRYRYYEMHKDFYQAIFEKEILSHFPRQQPIITYAPTWQDFENGSTFFDYGQEIIKRLPDHYNMIVKLHPIMQKVNPQLYEEMVGAIERKPNLMLTDSFLPVYPILEHTSIYIGDSSAIGYDFLVYNRPMFFINKFKRNPGWDRRLYLTHCGHLINPAEVSSLYSYIEKHLESDPKAFSEIRKQVDAYTFAPEKGFEHIRQHVIAACSTHDPYKHMC